MGWEVEKIIRGATKPGLRGSNAKTKKYLRHGPVAAKNANLLNTCPIWTSEDLFERYWSTEKESEIRFKILRIS